jgi:small-conductance mechanosensitive channel
MTVPRIQAAAPLTDIGTWLRGSGLEIVLLVLGGLLLARFATWSGRKITERIDAAATDLDALVRSEAAKHRRAVGQVLTWLSMALIWSVAGVLILERLGVPVSSMIASAAVIGAALGFGAQQVVRDLLAGIFIVAERQYGYGDMVHISAVGFEGATGTIEEVALRTTRLRTLNGEVVIVPNGLIVGVTNLSRDWARAVVDVPLPAGVDVVRANELLRKVGADAFQDEALRPLLLDAPTVMGVESFEVGQVNLRMVARTCPASSSRWPVSCGSGWPLPSGARASSPPRARLRSRAPVAGDGWPAARHAAARQAANLDPAAVAAVRGRASPVPAGPAPARRRHGQPRRLGVGRRSAAHRVRASHEVTHLDSDLCAGDDRNRGSDHHGRPHHTDHSANIEQPEDHRELGDLR